MNNKCHLLWWILNSYFVLHTQIILRCHYPAIGLNSLCFLHFISFLHISYWCTYGLICLGRQWTPYLHRHSRHFFMDIRLFLSTCILFVQLIFHTSNVPMHHGDSNQDRFYCSIRMKNISYILQWLYNSCVLY